MHTPARHRITPLLVLPLALVLVAALAPTARADWKLGGGREGGRHADHDTDRHSDRRYDRDDDGGHARDRQGHRDGGYGHHAAYVAPGVRVVLGDVALYWNPFYLESYGHHYRAYRAPRVGARVHYLPAGYVSFRIGRSRYYGVGGTFYLWDPPRREYVVVEKPLGAEEAMAAPGAQREDLFIYPSEGQDEDTREWDRYACHEWAVAETAQGLGRATPGTPARADYLRAVGACLEGRGYAVK